MSTTNINAQYTLEELLHRPRPELEQALKDLVSWKTEEVTIKDEILGAVFQATVEIPEDWSSTAATIIAQKYFRKRGVGSFHTTLVSENNVPSALSASRQLGQLKTTKYDGETSAAQVFFRLTGCWAYWGWKNGYFKTESELIGFIKHIYLGLAKQRFAPNSPQWFNTGLNWAYGITGPAQGHWYVEPVSKKAHPSEDSYTRMQAQACFILGMKDNLVEENGILDTWKNEARIFKFGSGSGVNISNLRGKKEALSGGGKSSGLISFAKIGDRSAAAIQSGGVTRRAAKMVLVDADHPDVEDFINWKVDEERKVAYLAAGSSLCFEHLSNILHAVSDDKFAPDTPISVRLDLKRNTELKRVLRAALQTKIPKEVIYRALDCIQQGVDVRFEEIGLGWEGQGYDTVSGQNSNNSVRIPNKLMSAAYDNSFSSDWPLINRTDGKVSKTLDAHKLMKDIAQAAWLCADPGIQYSDTINEWHTCSASGLINASNPCSEYLFLDDTSCNLASQNLVSYLNKKTSEFDIASFVEDASLLTKVLDISVTMAHFPTKEIAVNSFNTRTLGLGYANLGALLMLLGVPYDSPKAFQIAGAITSLMSATAYRTSVEMAETLGAFEWFEKNREFTEKVLHNHMVAAGGTKESYRNLSIEPTPLTISSDNLPWVHETARLSRVFWAEVNEGVKTVGVRNAQVTVLAPTGTISFVMDCDTTGIEPDFSLIKFKKLAGGGNLIVVNQAVESALSTMGYPQDVVKRALMHIGGRRNILSTVKANKSKVSKILTPQECSRINTELSKGGIYSLDQVLSPDYMSKQSYDKLTVNGSGLHDKLSVLLETSEPNLIEDYILEVLGHGNLEEFTEVSEEAKEVFVCANVCGARGTKSIPWLAHIEMMAAVQPFISGAISKTVNLPNNVTINDIEDIYRTAWLKSVKCVAVYRDGSKLSQPLSSGTGLRLLEGLNDEEESTEATEEVFSTEAIRKVLTSGHTDSILPLLTDSMRGVRKPLPSRRKGATQKAKIGGQSIYIHTGEYADGTLGEIFVDMYKEGSSMQAVLNAFSRAVSIGLQYGVPLDTFIDSFVSSKFEPAGFVQEHDNIKMTTSILDYVFRDLGISYLEMDHFANVKPEREVDNVLPSVTTANQVDSKPMASNPVVVDSEIAHSGTAKVMLTAYSGDPCSSCNSLTLVRSGTCYACTSCGSTTGCS